MKQISEPRENGVHIATYNIHGWVGRDKRHDPQRIINVICQLECSIIALQEVTLNLEGKHGSEKFLSQRTGLQVISGPTLYDERGSYGNVLLSAHPVEGVRRLDLSQPGREPRGALEAELLVDGRLIRVVICHLGLKAAERRRQMAMLRESMGPLQGRRVILMGDFNEWRPGSPLLRRINQSFGCPPSPPTFPARMPFLALDRIWASPPARLKSLSVHNTPGARLASDHLPLKAVVDIA